MGQQHALAGDLDDFVVAQETATGRRGESLTDQEVPVAVHEVARYAAAFQVGECCDDGFELRVGHVVAYPRFEHVAKNVERLGRGRLLLDKANKPGDSGRPFRVKVQVGDEEGIHPAIRCSPASGRRVPRLFADHLDAFDDDILHRNIAFEMRVGAGGYVADLVDDFHALDDGPEYGVAPARRARVQIQVVDQIDVELGIARVGIGRSCEANRPAQVAQAVTRLVGNHSLGRLELKVAGVAARLGHKTLDDPVEYSAFVVAFTHIGQEVLDRERRPVHVQFDHEAAGVGHDIDPRIRGDHFRWFLLSVGEPGGQRGADQ